MLAATPELARYSFATAVILGAAAPVRTEPHATGYALIDRAGADVP